MEKEAGPSLCNAVIFQRVQHPDLARELPQGGTAQEQDTGQDVDKKQITDTIKPTF